MGRVKEMWIEQEESKDGLVTELLHALEHAFDIIYGGEAPTAKSYEMIEDAINKATAMQP